MLLSKGIHHKFANDIHGHDVGDQALQMVSRTLQATQRPFDRYGRWGGEEFLGLVRNVDDKGLAAVGQRCRQLIAESSLPLEDRALSITVSIGATLVRSHDTAESLFRRVDELLYQSKDNGRNRLTVG